MHVFQIESLTDIIYAIPITIVCKPFLGNHFIYFYLCCQSLASDVWLCENSAEEAVCVTRVAYDIHLRFGK